MDERELLAIGWNDISPSWLASAIERQGAALVRDFLPADQCDMLADGIDRTFAAYDSQANDEWYSPFTSKSRDLDHSRRWLRGHGGVCAVESPTMLDRLIRVYQQRGVVDWVRNYLGEHPVLSSYKTTLRKTDSKTQSVGWHQDGAFLGADARVLNIWVALTHCGDSAPGIDLALRRQSNIVGTGEEGASYYWSVSDLRARREAGDVITPVMRPGDALFFDHLCLHRTSTKPATETRFAIEAWFFAPSTLPDHYDAVAV